MLMSTAAVEHHCGVNKSMIHFTFQT